MSDWVLSLKGESKSLKRRNESSWVGDNLREKTCMVEIKKKKKILHSYSSDSISDSNSDNTVSFFIFIFSKKRKWQDSDSPPYDIFYFFKKCKWQDTRVIDKTTQWWDYSSWHTFFDWEK